MMGRTRALMAIAIVALAMSSFEFPALGADPSPAGSSDPGPVIVYQWAPDGVQYMSPDGSMIQHPLAGFGMELLHPDWSPDGSRLAFDVETDDGVDIWTSAADGSDRTLLLDNADCPSGDCVEVSLPAWSPDGRIMAFARLRANETGIVAFTIEVMDIATGDTRVIATNPPVTALQYPRWCAGGRSIVYQFTTFPTDGEGPATGSGIAIVDAVAPDAEPVTLTDPALFGAYPDCRWSDDLIVFTTYDLSEYQQTDEPSNLYTVRADGTELTQLTTFGRSEQRATQPTWTPDGTRILFTLVGQSTGEFDNPRHAAFVDEDGEGLDVLAPEATHPRLRP